MCEGRAAVDLEPEVLRERYREAGRRTGGRFSLRWMLLHPVEETARHAGHADLLREAVDGVVGG